MASSDSSDIPVVLVTGFGPFRSVMVNPSWEVAKVLKNYLEWTRPIHLIIEQMNVTYEDVSKRIPDHWLKYNPTVSCCFFFSLSPSSSDLVFSLLVSYSYWCRSWIGRSSYRTMCLQC